MELLAASHPVQIKQFLTNNRVQEEDFVELPQLEEENLFEIIYFQVPVLPHAWRGGIQILLRNVKTRWIILGIIWPTLLLVHELVRFQEFWKCIMDVLNFAKAASYDLVFLVDDFSCLALLSFLWDWC